MSKANLPQPPGSFGMMETLDYEGLVEHFGTTLLTRLRGHGADADYLEMWVPDENPVKSILNMVEAAEAAGRDQIAVRVRTDTVSAAQLQQLRGALAALGAVAVEPVEGANVIRVTGIER